MVNRLVALIQNNPGRFLALAGSLASLAAAGCTSASPSGEEGVPEAVTAWAPVGARTVGAYGYEIIPQPNAFHTMHVGPNNTDNVWVATAPRMELAWVSETNFYVPEGPTFDNEGNRSTPKPASETGRSKATAATPAAAPF